MVRISDFKTKYIPVEKVGILTTIRWGYEDVFEDVYEETGEVDEYGIPIRVPTGKKKKTNLATWTYEKFVNEISFDYVKNMILNWYNKLIDEKILSGFVWNTMPVWLSSENLFNYKAAYDLALQTNGESLPITFKFGTTNNSVYYTFNTVAELSDFYTKAMAYINQTLAEGWDKKDAIDWTPYEEALNPKVEEQQVTEE